MKRKNKKNSGAGARALQERVAQAETELKLTRRAARQAKLEFKRARKAFKQAKKTAKLARKMAKRAAKRLPPRKSSSGPAKRRRTKPTTKRLIPGDASSSSRVTRAATGSPETATKPSATGT